MLIRPEIGFTYDCRRCENPVTASVGLFSLQARRQIFRCRCGESALVASMEQGRLIVEYPCSVCDRRHRAELSTEPVLSGEIVPLRCPSADIAAVYVGRPELLRRMDSTESDDEIAAFVGRLIGVQPKPEKPEETGDSCPSAADILCAARALADRNGIRCRCGSPRLTAAAEDGVLTVTCAVCGSEKTLPVRTKAALAKIRYCGMLIL